MIAFEILRTLYLYRSSKEEDHKSCSPQIVIFKAALPDLSLSLAIHFIDFLPMSLRKKGLSLEKYIVHVFNPTKRRLGRDETILQSPHSISATRSIHPYSDSVELVVHRSHFVSNISMKTRGINARL